MSSQAHSVNGDNLQTLSATPVVATNFGFDFPTTSQGWIVANIMAARASDGAAGWMSIRQNVKRLNGDAILQGAVIVLVPAAGDAAMAACTVDFVVVGGNRVCPRVTGLAATDVRWSGTVSCYIADL